MFTPVLNPDSSSSMKTNPSSVPPPSQYQLELGRILCTHDPNAVRLYDFMNYVKVFLYNSNESRWENNSYIEGNLFVYKRQQIVQNQIQQAFAFAVIQGERHLIQPISPDMSEQADKLRLFYEITRNQKSQVVSLHFSDERECRRLHSFIHQTLQNMKEQQNRMFAAGELQSKPIQEQPPSTVAPQSQTIRPDSVTVQLGSARQTPTHVASRQSTPVVNSGLSTNDPTSSLKRLLNIPSQQDFDPESSHSSPQKSVDLLPPSAFASVSGTVSSPVASSQGYHHLQPQAYPSNLLSRDHLRNVLLHLVQTNDQFLDMIHQACLSSSTQ